ncbi:MAG TPA: hypothetical protein VFN54_09540 [Acidimicrobiales bacterium]|nr:hypothetical protein [Acidimicrobiales bacterium]
MTGLFIFVGVLFALTIGAVALSARYRRFDPVVTFDEPSVFPNAQMTLLATPEEVTRETLSDHQHYDAEDDLLDPHHSPASPTEDDTPAS